MEAIRRTAVGHAHESCSVVVYGSFAEDHLIRRVRGEFHEMPGMCVTLTQASRLWTLDQEACTRVLGALVAARCSCSARPSRPRKPSSHGLRLV